MVGGIAGPSREVVAIYVMQVPCLVNPPARLGSTKYDGSRERLFGPSSQRHRDRPFRDFEHYGILVSHESLRARSTLARSTAQAIFRSVPDGASLD